MTKQPKISSKERYLKFSLFIPDNNRMRTVLRDLELSYHDVGLRILQSGNG